MDSTEVVDVMDGQEKKNRYVISPWVNLCYVVD